MKPHSFSAVFPALAAAALLTFAPANAGAEDWFIPGQQKQGQAQPPRAGAPAPPHPTRAPGHGERGPVRGMPAEAAGPAPLEQAQAPPRVQLPAIPQLPQLPRGPTPPAAVIGVLGVPEVMRASTAAQQVEKILGGRREKLNQDAQKEQAAWRDMQQSLANERAKLSAEQIRTKERELQDRVASAQRQFRERNKIIQDAAQYALAQIERTLIAVIRQVSESRGMNLVLHRAQVALNVNEFDITQQVTEQLNKLLPAVNIPAEGQEPPMAANTGTGAPVPAANAAAGEAAGAGGTQVTANPTEAVQTGTSAPSLAPAAENPAAPPAPSAPAEQRGPEPARK